jgi:hypothetical protein
MPIPFENGVNYLPPGIHKTTVKEVEEALVNEFPESKTRRKIFEQWQALTEEIDGIVPIRAQWLNGSFVSRKLDPGDLDVATIIDSADADALGADARGMLWKLLSGPNNELYPLIDSWPIVLYPPAHPVHRWAEADKATFEEVFFARDDRASPPIVKGFIEVQP